MIHLLREMLWDYGVKGSLHMAIVHGHGLYIPKEKVVFLNGAVNHPDLWVLASPRAGLCLQSCLWFSWTIVERQASQVRDLKTCRG